MALYTDNFAGVTPGSDINARSIGAKVWRTITANRHLGNPGGDAVRHGGTASTGSTYVNDSGTAGDVADIPYADIEIEIRFRFIGSTATRFAGVYARSASLHTGGAGDNFYWARVYAGNVELYKSVNGTFTLLDSDAFSPTLGTWYTLKLRVTDAAKTVYIDGTAYSTSSDNSIAYSATANTQGVGFNTYTSGAATTTDTVEVDDFSVSQYVPSVTSADSWAWSDSATRTVSSGQSRTAGDTWAWTDTAPRTRHQNATVGLGYPGGEVYPGGATYPGGIGDHWAWYETATRGAVVHGGLSRSAHPDAWAWSDSAARVLSLVRLRTASDTWGWSDATGPPTAVVVKYKLPVSANFVSARGHTADFVSARSQTADFVTSPSTVT